MENKDLQFIQNQIGYNFKNLDLLQQAFVRRSYAEENGGEDNEVLEFIGDRALEFVIVKKLVEEYGYYRSDRKDYDPDRDFDEFGSKYNEGDLTEIKKNLVEKKMLAHRMDILGFAEYLILGKGDEKNHIDKQESVREDLFEAIIGAVTLDSSWDITEIEGVVEIMLDPESYLDGKKKDNYVELIQDWTGEKNGTVPFYHFEKGGYQVTWYTPFNGVSQTFEANDKRAGKVQFRCFMKIDEKLPVFRGFGASKSEARKAVCEVAYRYLEKHELTRSIKNEIRDPNRADAINQLETLARRGYFSIPSYEFRRSYTSCGDPLWKCRCCIKENERTFSAEASSKKEAKKSAAYDMLKNVIKKRPE